MISTLERRYILFLLFAVSVFNYIDRTILSILQIPIKAELHLSDAQLGALTGLAFAIFYAVLGVPLGRLADHVRRKYLIAGALTVWSGMTALTGLANSFASLIGYRIGVAAGEAGSIPASHSMISDLYPPNARATAISIFGLSLPMGMVIGYLSAGWLATSFGWRESFAVVGIAGLLLVPILLLTMKEPTRGRFDPPSAVGEKPPAFKEALGILWSKKAFRYLVLAGSFHAYAWYTVNAWNAPFYTRVHGLSLPEASNYLALINGVGSALGMFVGAWLADHFGKKDPRGRARVVAIALFIMVPIGLAQYLVGSTIASQILGGLTQVMMLVYYGPIVALCHSLMPPKMRGLTSAVLALILSLFGLGLGPWVTGILSDTFTASLGANSNALGFAICISILASFVSAIFFWRASNLMPLEMLRDETEPVAIR
ncbi:MAG: MFS transporter [Azonexus sp.]|jgi:MFS family permease|nr:MFS transporter [Azonexus sp.]